MHVVCYYASCKVQNSEIQGNNYNLLSPYFIVYAFRPTYHFLSLLFPFYLRVALLHVGSVFVSVNIYE